MAGARITGIRRCGNSTANLAEFQSAWQPERRRRTGFPTPRPGAMSEPFADTHQAGTAFGGTSVLSPLRLAPPIGPRALGRASCLGAKLRKSGSSSQAPEDRATPHSGGGGVLTRPCTLTTANHSSAPSGPLRTAVNPPPLSLPLPSLWRLALPTASWNSLFSIQQPRGGRNQTPPTLPPAATAGTAAASAGNLAGSSISC